VCDILQMIHTQLGTRVIWMGIGTVVFVVLLILRVLGMRLRFTENKKFWCLLHVFWFAWGGAILSFNEQIFLIVFSVLFEMFEFIGCTWCTHLCSNLFPNRYKVVLHDVMMNLCAQIVGVCLSGRFLK
jgi:hypothetical protein